MTTALAAVTPKLGKLLALLASDKDGEVLGAVRAIGRTLKQAGADFNDLAAAVTRAEPLGAVDPVVEPLAWRDIPESEQARWLARMSGSRRLSAWEQDFASSILAQVRFRPWSALSPNTASDYLQMCRDGEAVFSLAEYARLLGVSRAELYRWDTLASISDDEFEAVLADFRARGKKLSTTAVADEIRRRTGRAREYSETCPHCGGELRRRWR